MRKDGPSEGRRIERAHTTDELVELNVTFPPRTPNIPIDLRLFTLLPPPLHTECRGCVTSSVNFAAMTMAHLTVYFNVPKNCVQFQRKKRNGRK